MKITKALVQKIYKSIDVKAHKGTQGYALLIGGSYGKIGSVGLSSKAAIKAGCGLVTGFIPKCGYGILQSMIPEVMVLTDKNKKYLSRIKFQIEPDAIGIGPGIGQEQATQKAFYKFIKNNGRPLVIDADGLNILAQNKSWLELLQPKTVLTPHPKELQRLLGDWKSDAQMLQMTVGFSKRYKLIIVMKGAPTQIIDGDIVYENTTGNQALATAGSGDVLTGIITSLLAQSYDPINATILGVYLHGLTADLALPETGHESFIASDIIGYLGKAFLSLKDSRNEIGFK